MSEKRNIILFCTLILLTLSFWGSFSLLIGAKPTEVQKLEDEQIELNENLISAQILASKLDRVYTLFQKNLALSQQDSLADDASMPFLNNLTDMLDKLNIQVLSIKPRDREKEGSYYRAPYELTLKCSFEQFGKYLAEIERSPRLVSLDEFEVKNGIERIKSKTSEEDLAEQVFEIYLSTMTLVKSKSKVVK